MHRPPYKFTSFRFFVYCALVGAIAIAGGLVLEALFGRSVWLWYGVVMVAFAAIAGRSADKFLKH
jgi:hypothetical protein